MSGLKGGGDNSIRLENQIKERVILKKGKLILSHISDGWELVPRSIVELLGNRKNIFLKFAFYENGIELYYKSEKKVPLFVSYSDIETVYIISRDFFKPYLKYGDDFPSWLVIDTKNERIKTYQSRSLPVDKIKSIIIEKECKIGYKIIDNFGTFDYSIKEYSFKDDRFEIIFLDDRKEKYYWNDVEKISSRTEPTLNITFYNGSSLSLHPSEFEFIIQFRKNYEKYIDKIEKDVLVLE